MRKKSSFAKKLSILAIISLTDGTGSDDEVFMTRNLELYEYDERKYNHMQVLISPASENMYVGISDNRHKIFKKTFNLLLTE